MAMPDRRLLAANYSAALEQVIGQCRVDYVKVPTVGSVYDDMAPAAALGRPLLLHNAHVNVPLAEADLFRSFDMARFRDVIQRTRTPHLSFHLDAVSPPGDPNDLVDTAVRNTRRLIAELDRPILVETPCLWAERSHTLSLALPHNLRLILEETGAGLLLDVSHVRCTAHCLGLGESAYMDSLPIARTHEIHLAGSRLLDGRGRIDVHAPLDETDYLLLQRLLDVTPARFVTLEYGGRTAGSAEEECRRHGIERNSPQQLEMQLLRLARMLEQ